MPLSHDLKNNLKMSEKKTDFLNFHSVFFLALVDIIDIKHKYIAWGTVSCCSLLFIGIYTICLVYWYDMRLHSIIVNIFLFNCRYIRSIYYLFNWISNNNFWVNFKWTKNWTINTTKDILSLQQQQHMQIN